MTVSKDILKKKNFCSLPWIHFHAWPDGKVFPCCVANSNKPISSTASESIIKMVNSDEFKQLRLNMLNDQPSDICQRCYDLEALGAWSLRKSYLKQQYLPLIEATKEDGSIDHFKMLYMDIRWSNICNMKCRSCGPSCSSLWAQEFKERHGEAVLKNNFGLSKILVSNNEEDKFWNKLNPYLNDVEDVYFAGGEALITPEHYRILDHWLTTGKTDVRLSYTTNFSVFKYKDKNVLDYWKKFPNLEICASLDANQGLGEYLRKGTIWNEIEENAFMIKREVPHAKFCITPTISLWNAHQFPKFHQEWIDKGLLSKNDNTRINILTQPHYCSLLVAPKFYKEKLAELYRPIAEDRSYSMSIRNGYKTILTALESGTEDKTALKEFYHFNKKLDDHRNENLLEVIPELKEVYEWTYN
jgi:hypothetical protein